jgi:hypothetical protein
MSLDAELAAARRFLLSEPKVLRRKVCNVVADPDTPAAQHIFTLALGHQHTWTPKDWKAVLDNLDENDMTVDEWLASRIDE